ncbi:MAG TPA: DUF1707 domain-containing protein [Streptosporangiaceae bacterium]|nr:DUF1707 domain-containing protein [Streptosporangiaceae bacterium]
MTVADPKTRASDADRDRAADLLREHYAAGRLTAEEFSERLDKAYAAKTLGELENLRTDLPAPDLSSLPEPRPSHTAGAVAATPGRFSLAWRAAWASWLSISIVCFAIWLASGATGSLWFLWVAGVLGALMLARWITGTPPTGERRPARRERRHGHSREI